MQMSGLEWAKRAGMMSMANISKCSTLVADLLQTEQPYRDMLQAQQEGGLMLYFRFRARGRMHPPVE